MRFLWIVVSCPVFLLMITSSASALEWSLESLFYPMTYIGNKIENTVSKSLSRHKRADPAPQEYIFDIEVTLVNASFLNALRTFVKELTLPIGTTINGTLLNITSLEVTTVCTAKESWVNCSCESGYVWPSDVCPATPTCVGSSNTCDCLTAYPSQGCELSQSPGPIETRKMLMRVLKEYDQNMADPSSKEYQELKKQLNDSYLVAYGSLPGFRYANVTDFRNGSIIVDYTVVARQVTHRNITPENLIVVDYLSARSVPVDPNGFKTIINDKTNFTALPMIIFQGDTVHLTCKTTSSSTAVTWSHNETNIFAGGRKNVSSSISSDGTSVSTLTISQIDFSDDGSYTCSLEDDLNIYIQSKDLVVQRLQVESNTTVVCGGDKVDIFKCCTNDNIRSFTANCTVGAQGFPGLVTSYPSCVAYSVQPSIFNCQIGSTVANYSCECYTGSGAKKELTIPVIFIGPAVVPCNNSDLGMGTAGAIAEKQKNCVSPAIYNIGVQFQALLQNPNFQQQVPDFLTQLSSTVIGTKENVSSSSANIVAILGILQTISVRVKNVSVESMKNVINIVGVMVENATAWEALSPAEKITNSSLLLSAVDTFANKLQNFSNDINLKAESRNIILQGINIASENDVYNKMFNFSNVAGDVQIPSGRLSINTTVVTIAYASLVDILPGGENKSEVNSLVMSTVLNRNISNNDFKILMTFPKINASLVKPMCVYWNFSQGNGTGGWDNTGCQENDTGNAVTCTCDHLTSFSILMSSSDNFPNNVKSILNYITYIGVGISLASLVICILIEALVWKSVTKNKTSYMRHVCLVNIAVSLLIADIWFIIGSRMSDILVEAANNKKTTNAGDACVTATFFTQFFYLSLFFWMLTMGLILFYRMVYVFHDMSKTTMMGICFCLGYGCPLIISVITVAVTQPSNLYREGLTCWLNITSTKAFLAFVVPALTIVGANFIILIVVIVKLLRPSVGDRPSREEKSTLVKIAKSVAVLTPLLGLTWGFGIGTIISTNVVIQGIFSALNSLQGLFILVFATLWDTKVREALLHRLSLSRWASQQTKSTKTTTVSSSRPGDSRPTIKPNIKMPKFAKPGYNIFGAKGRYSIASAFKSTSLEEDSYYSSLE